LLPEIANSVSLQILKNFAEKVAVYCFKESQLNDFAEGGFNINLYFNRNFD